MSLRHDMRAAIVSAVAEQRGIRHDEAAAEITNHLNRGLFDAVIEAAITVAEAHTTKLAQTAYGVGFTRALMTETQTVDGTITGRTYLRLPPFQDVEPRSEGESR